MSDMAFDRDPGVATAPRKPRANLGTADAEEIFMSFDTKILRRFFAFLKPHRAFLYAAQAAVLCSAGSQLMIPFLIGRAVTAAQEHDPSRLDRVVAMFVGVAVFYAFAFFTDQWMSSRLAQAVIFDVRRAMFAHFQQVSLSFMDKTHVGRVMSRLQGDVNALQEFLESSTGALGDFAVLIGTVIFMLVMNWKLGLLTMLVLPALVGIRAIWLPFSKTTFRNARDASSIANGALAENINGIRTVQETRREAMNFELYEEKARGNMTAQIQSSALTQVMVPTVDILTGFAMAVIIVVGGGEVLNQELQVGAMVSYVFYVQRFFDPVRMLSMQYTIMQRAMAAGHRIFEVLDVPVSIVNKPDAVVLKDVEPTVELDHVTFGYSPDRVVLHDVSLKVAPRQVVALVGPTGSGKTSIMSLVRRFYEVDQGRVLVGGHDVRDVTLESLGQTIGMVLQEPFLFTGTIEENIRYNTAGATHEDIVAAAKAVSAHDFIMRLPDGYQTQLGQRGRNISLGQRQLLSFARALVANPKILILDEATANIDSFTELEIQRALKVLFAGRTCLVIAHRLATVRDADMIVVLQQGHIIEQGPHDALIARNGLYAKLYSSSHGSFDDLPGEGEQRADRGIVAT
ncbi:ABC transporter ATP-binding protein [Caulobacter sp. KR2-114]|uniref:ABC transporter ATP-binding protein n=1 Tax=Caulobacter sp. KR2-114 TaxID=3400912 RepID=UPI003BFFF721